VVFNARYARLRKSFAVVPLLYDDERQDGSPQAERRYISYIGTIAEDHAFAEFLDFVAACCERNLFPAHQFLIATKSSLSTLARSAVATAVGSGRLVVQAGRPLTNEEINAYYAGSVVVWNAYKRSMQSGVLAKCYMFGTPVLVSTANANEFFQDRTNGVGVSAKYGFAELQAAVEDIILNFAAYSAQCRGCFLRVFYYKAHLADFMALTGS